MTVREIPPAPIRVLSSRQSLLREKKRRESQREERTITANSPLFPPILFHENVLLHLTRHTIIYWPKVCLKRLINQILTPFLSMLFDIERAFVLSSFPPLLWSENTFFGLFLGDVPKNMLFLIRYARNFPINLAKLPYFCPDKINTPFKRALSIFTQKALY